MGIVEEFEYVMCIDSTLGIENFAKGNKTGFFFNRPYKFPITTRRLGGMENFPRKGLNWTTYNDEKEFQRVFNFVTNSKDKVWKGLKKKYASKAMKYDYSNKKFLKILKKVTR